MKQKVNYDNQSSPLQDQDWNIDQRNYHAGSKNQSHRQNQNPRQSEISKQDQASQLGASEQQQNQNTHAQQNDHFTGPDPAIGSLFDI